MKKKQKEWVRMGGRGGGVSFYMWGRGRGYVRKGGDSSVL